MIFILYIPHASKQLNSFMHMRLFRYSRIFNITYVLSILKRITIWIFEIYNPTMTASCNIEMIKTYNPISLYLLLGQALMKRNLSTYGIQ